MTLNKLMYVCVSFVNCSEIQTKEIVFEEKLKTLESLQANVQAYLTLSTAFIGSASKFELLKLANGLVERLSDIGTVVHPTKYSICYLKGIYICLLINMIN